MLFNLTSCFSWITSFITNLGFYFFLRKYYVCQFQIIFIYLIKYLLAITFFWLLLFLLLFIVLFDYTTSLSLIASYYTLTFNFFYCRSWLFFLNNRQNLSWFSLFHNSGCRSTWIFLGLHFLPLYFYFLFFSLSNNLWWLDFNYFFLFLTLFLFIWQRFFDGFIRSCIRIFW